MLSPGLQMRCASRAGGERTGRGGTAGHLLVLLLHLAEAIDDGLQLRNGRLVVLIHKVHLPLALFGILLGVEALA